MQSVVAMKSSKLSKESSSPISNTSDDSDIINLGETYHVDVEKYGIIAELSAHDFDVIESPNGWLENSIIQYAQSLLKTVNPAIQGFQHTSLGIYLNLKKLMGILFRYCTLGAIIGYVKAQLDVKKDL